MMRLFGQLTVDSLRLWWAGSRTLAGTPSKSTLGFGVAMAGLVWVQAAARGAWPAAGEAASLTGPSAHRWVGILTLYLLHRGKMNCAGGGLLSAYLVVLLALLALVIGSVLAIVWVSMRGQERHHTGTLGLALSYQLC